MTFERVVQSGIEDGGYARRIARLRGYYFDQAPELAPYLLSVPPEQRLQVQGITGGRWQPYRTVAGMVAVITAVLACAGLGLLAAVASHHSLAAALATAGIVAVAAVSVLTRYQRSAGCRAACALLATDEQAQPPTDPGKKLSTRRRVAAQKPHT